MGEEEKKEEVTIGAKEKLIAKLTDEEREVLQEIDPKHITYLKNFTPEQRNVIYELCTKIHKDERVTEEDLFTFDYLVKPRLLEMGQSYDYLEIYCKEATPEALKVCIELTTPELHLLAKLIKAKELVKAVVLPPIAKPPPEKIPELKPIELEEIHPAIRPTFPPITAKPRVKPPKLKGRGRYPFKTSDFIKGFLAARGVRGGYSYEVWFSLKSILQGVIEYPEIEDVNGMADLITEQSKERVRRKGKEGIQIDGMVIDGALIEGLEDYAEGIGSKRVPVRKQREAVYKIPSYGSIRSYFWVLKQLGLIELTKKEPGEWISGVKVEKHYYNLVAEPIKANGKKLTTKEIKEIWESPKQIAYPLSVLGKFQWESYKLDAEERRDGIISLTKKEKAKLTKLGYTEEDINLKLWFVLHPPKIKKEDIIIKASKLRGLHKEQLEQMIIKGHYFSFWFLYMPTFTVDCHSKINI